MKSFKRRASRYMPAKLLWAWQSWRYAKFGEPEIALVPLVAGSGVGVDVGAADGMYTRALSRVSSQVYAYEANPKAAARLARVTPANVHVVPKAVSDRAGMAHLEIPDDENIYGFGTLEVGGVKAKASTIPVPCCRLDDESLGAVSFMKIDVEGHEHKVLLGAVEMIRHHRPTILVELEERHRPGCVEQAVRFLGEFGYAGHFQRQGNLHPISAFTPERDQVWEKLERGNYINNFLFLPPGQGTLLAPG